MKGGSPSSFKYYSSQTNNLMHIFLFVTANASDIFQRNTSVFCFACVRTIDAFHKRSRQENGYSPVSQRPRLHLWEKRWDQGKTPVYQKRDYLHKYPASVLWFQINEPLIWICGSERSLSPLVHAHSSIISVLPLLFSWMTHSYWYFWISKGYHVKCDLSFEFEFIGWLILMHLVFMRMVD